MMYLDDGFSSQKKRKKGTNQPLVPTLRAGRILMILNLWRWFDKRPHTEQQNSKGRLRKR